MVISRYSAGFGLKPCGTEVLGSGNCGTPCWRMHTAIFRSCAIVCADGGGPGLSGPPPGMNLRHFACAALNAGDEMIPARAWNSKPPPGFGSGKLETPLARMHLANASAPGGPALGPVEPALTDSTPRWSRAPTVARSGWESFLRILRPGPHSRALRRRAGALAAGSASWDDCCLASRLLLDRLVCASVLRGGVFRDRFAPARATSGVDTLRGSRRTGPNAQKSRIDRALQAFARTRLGGWLFVSVFPAIDRWLIPRTGGRLKVALGQPILLLHTRGAKSGQLRRIPLLYTPHGEGFVVVASKAGAAHHPAWYHNLRAHPDAVTVELGGKNIAVRPRVVDEPERSELWQRVNDNYNGYDAYEQRAGGRVIPVVLLEPISRQETGPGV